MPSSPPWTNGSLRASAGERNCAWAENGLCETEPFGLFSACFEQSDTYARETFFCSIIQVYMCRLLGTPSEWKGHVRSAWFFVSEDMMPRKVRRRVEKLQPYAVFGRGTFPHADSLPRPGLLRTARPGRLRAVTLPQGPPKGARRKCYYMIPSQRGQPLWVGYAWDVRALGCLDLTP